MLISEYIDASTTRCGLELWNVSGSNITFGTASGQLDVRVEVYANGSATATGLTILTAGATVTTGGVYVVSHPQAAFFQIANQTSTAMSWTGDDAIVIRLGAGGPVMDSLGQIGFDPGTEWGTGDVSTADNTLRRKFGNYVADTNPLNAYDPAPYFDGYPVDNTDDLGKPPVANVLPTIATIPPFVVGTNDATLYGVVDSHNTTTYIWFQWGTSMNYSDATLPQMAGSGSHGFQSVISNLVYGTTYHYRAVAGNSLGTVYGTNVTFVTSNRAPLMATLPATNIMGQAARLNGVLNPNGTNSTVWFEWGSTTNYGTTVLVGTSIPVSTNIYFYSDITGLYGSSTYHFRAVGSNVFGVTYGSNQTFTTLFVPLPSVATLPATSVSRHCRQLRYRLIVRC